MAECRSGGPPQAGPSRLLTVRELVAMPHLATHVLAGASGLDRPIAWANVFDHAEPWLWLQPDELVMTSGPTLVAGARAQGEYVTRLAQAGAAALAIGEHHLGPEITNEMLAAADRLGFPVLETAWEVPWATVARTVAEAGRDEGVIALAATERIYSALRAATLGGLSGGRLIAAVADSQGCTAAVLHAETGRVLLQDPDRRVPADLAERAQAALRLGRSRAMPTSVRISAGQHSGIVISLTHRHGAMLLVGYAGHRDPGPVIIRHLATVASAEHEQTVISRGRDQQRGAEIFERLLTERPPSATVQVELAERGLDGPLQVAALDLSDAGDRGLAAMYYALVEEGVPSLVRQDGDCGYVVLPALTSAVETLNAVQPSAGHIGLAEVVDARDGLDNAVRQARWVLNLARATGTTMVQHADERLAAFLPRTFEDARSVVDRILGPLVAHDEAKSTDLLVSLRTFLEENRSWQKGAARLYVHKQTLVYRMRKVEELSGLRLDSTEDVTQLWLALRTMDMLD